jgi:hypothetical protein
MARQFIWQDFLWQDSSYGKTTSAAPMCRIEQSDLFVSHSVFLSNKALVKVRLVE